MKIKKILSIMLSTAMIFQVSGCVNKSSASLQSKFKYEIIDKKNKTIKLTKVGDHNTIPEKINGYTITEIGENASFRGIQIPFSDKADYYSTIAAMVLLAPVTFGISFMISDSLYNPYDNIEFYSYYSEINKLNLPKLQSIGKWAFKKCTKLTSVNLPNLESADNYSFEACAFENISFPNLKSINEGVFIFCKNLKNIEAPNAESVSNRAFEGCEDLREVSLPNCKSVGTNAFKNCKNIKKISLPACESVSDNAFEGCENLKEISLPNCKSIGTNVFVGCKSLEKISFSAYESVNGKVFGDCQSLKEITISKAFYPYFLNESGMAYDVSSGKVKVILK